MQESKCVVKTCGSTINNLFCSPTDDNILKKWQEAIGTTESSFYVCDNHFSSKDVVVERYLEPLAVPTLDITEDVGDLDSDTCGVCMEGLKDEKIQLTKQNSDNFKLVTGYEPVKDQICKSCNQFLKTFQLFKTEIKEKHKKLRFKETQNNESDDDCVVVVSESNEKPSERQKLPRIVKLPPSITSTVKKLDDGKDNKTQFRCKHCYFKTNERMELIEHIDDTHYFPCQQCPFISSNKPLLTLHINKFHSKDKISIICGICDKTFKDKDEIDDHYDSKHDEQACSYFMCFYCKTNCKTGKELRCHYDQFHSRGLTTAQHQINNTKLQLALLISNKEKKTDSSKEKSYNEIVNKIKNVVTVKKVPKNKKKRRTSSSCPLPLNTPIYIGQSEKPEPPKPKKRRSGPKITEVTIVNNSNNFLAEIPDPVTSSDEEIEAVIADITDTISLDSDSDYEVPLKKLAENPTPEKPKDIQSVLKNRVQTIKEGTRHEKEMDPNLRYVFRCFTCDEYYDDVTKLLKHREDVHPPLEKLKNYQPFDLSAIPPDTTKFVRKKPEKKNEKVACDICNFLVLESNLEKHKRRVHAEKDMLCHICSQLFHSFTFRYHMMKHEPETMYKCDMCDKGWVTKGMLAKHIRRTHLKIPSIRAVCPICNKKIYRSLKERNGLEVHMKKYHPDGKDDGHRVNEETNFYDCEKCGASYWDLYTFIRHSCDKGRNQIRCLDCMIPCSSFEALAKHKVTKCRKINPFTNSVGLKDIEAVKEKMSKNPQYRKMLQHHQNYQQQHPQQQYDSQVQTQTQQPQTSQTDTQNSRIQIQSQQFFHFHPQYQPQFFSNYQN